MDSIVIIEPEIEVIETPAELLITDEPIVTTFVERERGAPGEKGEKGGKGDPGPQADEIYMTAGVGGVSALKVIRGNVGNVGAYADSDEVPNSIAGVSFSAANEGDDFLVRGAGLVTDSGWNWDLTRPIFLGKGGALTQAADTGEYVVVIGYPVAADKMIIRIGGFVKTVS